MGNSTGAASITADVPDPHQLPRLVCVLGADVDVEILELRHLLAILVLEQVDRLATDDAGDGAVPRADHDPLADEHDRVPAADLAEAQVAVIVDVRDVQADLVDVADDREGRAAGRSRNPGPGGADVIGRDLVGEAGATLAPHLRGRRLMARRPGRGEQLV